MTTRAVGIGAALRLALLTGLGTAVMASLAYVVARSTDSITTGLVVRAALVTALLFLAPRIALRGRPRDVALPTAAVGLLLGYLR